MNSGDTAWILACSALVLLMTPGLAFFYAGLGRSKNASATIMYSFMSMGIVSVVWVLWGYTLAFGPDVGGFIGGLDYLGLAGVSAFESTLGLTISDQVFMIFQAMFAIITPALITGAFAERMKFSTYCVFIILWVTLVYAPVAHWVWGGGRGAQIRKDKLELYRLSMGFAGVPLHFGVERAQSPMTLR